MRLHLWRRTAGASSSSFGVRCRWSGLGQRRRRADSSFSIYASSHNNDAGGGAWLISRRRSHRRTSCMRNERLAWSHSTFHEPTTILRALAAAVYYSFALGIKSIIHWSASYQPPNALIGAYLLQNYQSITTRFEFLVALPITTLCQKINIIQSFYFLSGKAEQKPTCSPPGMRKCDCEFLT